MIQMKGSEPMIVGRRILTAIYFDSPDSRTKVALSFAFRGAEPATVNDVVKPTTAKVETVTRMLTVFNKPGPHASCRLSLSFGSEG